MIKYVMNFIDIYDVKARILPALIAIFSMIITCFVWFPKLSFSIDNVILNFFIVIAILLFLAIIARNKGKQKEKKLFAKWGGRPTTIILRHSDDTLDRLTKERYHNYLNNMIENVQILSKEEESKNKEKADENYRSAVKWLIENTRDKDKFPLVFQENCNYGFCRNSLGLKFIGVLISIASLAGKLGGIYFYRGNITSNVWISSLISFIFIVIWIFYITPKLVYNNAVAYAKALLRVCDKINQ